MKFSNLKRHTFWIIFGWLIISITMLGISSWQSPALPKINGWSLVALISAASVVFTYIILYQGEKTK